MNDAPVITVDGPSGSGKGTLAKALARQLDWHLLDSGALYRIVGWAADRRGVDLDDADAVAAFTRRLDISFAGGVALVDGELAEHHIRTEEVGALASRVAPHQPVRDALLDVQIGMRRPPGLVADGRDMGTVVFPTAQLKIYLEASAEERAQRRYKQLKDKGSPASLRALLESIEVRDERDKGRAVSPLVPADDAIILDSTALTIDEVIQRALALAAERGLAEV
ncbi:MAG: (d)CMP kinase [Pseudomonadota bacterium]